MVDDLRCRAAPEPQHGCDTESGGIAGTPDDFVQQALEAIRPDGPEHVWRPARPYMLPE
jgi:hypothetical protein